ncbi:SpvB/TcaC N-terminal domain-containing protein, partial [Streptomyces sp. NPDC058964]|uniref:SpvB/TcaC N-terminal domain-containing protein n=1 Tax=Streptomyces sp. NPDC058964 TaxID=3346681 RepID=UPI0036B7274A
MAEISVPKGGGALTGIGETFAPDLHTGTGNLTVPIPLPPVRGTPALSLSYSSGAGNGPYGLGWSLSVPRISRRTDRGVPDYDDRTDVFVLSGAEELVPVPPGNAIPADLPAGADVTRYRPRTEFGFARVVHVVGPSDDYWDVWTRSGLRNRYGTARPTGAAADWADPAAVRDPHGRVFSWLLTTSIDPLGNTICYRYRGDGGAQRYLDTIRYADFGDPNAPSYAVTLTVHYNDETKPRPDPFSDRRPGFDLRTTLRARRISVSTVGDGGTPPTVVDLRYADETPGPGPAVGVSLLTAIQITGQDAATGETQLLPPLTLGYRPWNPTARRFRRLPATLPPTALGPGLELADLFGDGLPSALQLDGTARYWRNRGDGRFDAGRPLRFAPAGAELGAPGVHLGDIDADGRPELTMTVGSRTVVWPLATPPPGSDQAGFEPTARTSTGMPDTGTHGPQVRLVDMDGDHIPDLLLAGERPLMARGDGRGGFARFRRIEGAPPLADLTDPHIHLADVTGDGLTDVVEVYDGAVRYWPSLGRGRFGPPVRMTDAPRFTDAPGSGVTAFDPRRILLGDVTGDGAADVVYVGDGTLTIWVNQSGNGFAPPVVVRGTPRVDSRTSVRIADLDGIGVGGVLWTGLGGAGEWAFLDLTGGAKPHLLTDVDNHCGAVTTLTWSTSTAYATAARLDDRPWRTALPFPVHVVAGVRTEDRFAQTVLTSGFHYSDGYWDPADREFRGFGRVVQTDTLTAATPPPPTPATLTLLDPLTPSVPVPAGFDAAAQGNLLRNWSFDTGGATPTTLTTSAAQPQGSEEAAAPGWTARNTAPATTVTDLVASDLPQGKGGQMLHITTSGEDCGVEQDVGGAEGTPAQVIATVWVKAVRGRVRVRIGTGDGRDAADATLDPTGQWTLVSVGSASGSAGRMSVTAADPGGAEIFLDHAWARTSDVPAEPVDGPPVRSVTWFALGPVGPSAGTWTAVDPSDDYWPGDPLLRPHLDLSALPDGLPRSTLREALRAVRGRVLRREVYADDGDPAHGTRPIEVHDSAFAVVPVLDGRSPTDPAWTAHPVVAVRAVLARETTWDRGDEPMVRLSASGGFDDYGRAHVSAEFGVARGRNPRRAGEPCLGTVTTTDFATRDDEDLFLLDRVARTARYEVTDPGTGPVLDLIAAVLGATPSQDPRSLQLTYYDGPAFTGLALGELGNYGLPTRVEQLVLTPDLLARIGAPAVPGGTSAPTPTYLAPDGATPASGAWSASYPDEFRDTVLTAPIERGTHVGYVWHDAAGPHVAGYYAQTSRTSYDVHTPVAGKTPRGMLLVTRDAFGGNTTTSWDDYDLVPVATTDAAGLTTTATYNYRVLKANLVTDPNGNRTAVGHTPLGLLAWIAELGRAGRSEGDTVDQPGQRFSYDLAAYDRSVADGGDLQPMSVTGVRRVHHRWTLVDRENARRASAGEQPLRPDQITAMFATTEEEDHPERFLRVVEFTDGLARLLQTRTQADDLAVGDVGLPEDLSPTARAVLADTTGDGPAVVVSGWKVYDNKSRPVVTFEPFRDVGWAYAPPTADRLAGLAAVRQHHDPCGRPTVTVAPDGSQTRVVHGRPANPADPGSVIPTPWESWTYGAEDNAGRTHPTESLDRWQQWNTPSSAVLDAFGRTVRTVRRGPAEDVVTTTDYDIEGQVVAVTDPLGRRIAATVFDLAGRAWTSWLLDACTRRTVHDALGGIVESRDDKGAVVLNAYDRAHRAVRAWGAAARGAGAAGAGGGRG